MIAGLLPEILVLAGAVAGLLAGMFARRDRQWIVAWICAGFLVAAAATTAVAAGGGMAVEGMAGGGMAGGSMAVEGYTVDALTIATRLAVVAATLVVLAMAAGWARGLRREAELYVLILLSSLGAILLAGAADLLLLVAAYLLASIPSYALAGFAKDANGTEAALKYYLMGAFLGVLMLAGVTLLYGVAGTTAYRQTGGAGVAAVLLMAGPLFKAGAVPAHFWVPDVAQGASRPIAAFVTTVPKLGAFAALFRLTTEVVDVRLAVALVAAATMTLGNLAAFYQDNVRRLLGYSTISQAGYLLLPVAAAGGTAMAEPALLFYLAAYAVTNLGAFAVVVAVGGDAVADYAGLARGRPWLAASLVVCLLGLVGTPPTAVFAGKVLAMSAAWGGGLAWLAVLAAVNTVASLFYYLRWILPLYRAGGAPGGSAGRVAWVAYLTAATSLVFGATLSIYYALS
ncbi:NADH-quinone oxidoreductase subunit N [Nonomuraea sp. bgisy101]|uniref:NADH-quinone oxidoreductase subunit N n=1 Tax=Nonomuraea sp. bgisy101 TaxID=3413784 RepID=UPI003D719603